MGVSILSLESFYRILIFVRRSVVQYGTVSKA